MLLEDSLRGVERVREWEGPIVDVGSGAGCEGQRDDAFHQVDEDERGAAGIKCGHGSTVAGALIFTAGVGM